MWRGWKNASENQFGSLQQEECYWELPAMVSAAFFNALAGYDQIRDCITVDTIHYIAIYIADSLNIDTVFNYKFNNIEHTIPQ